jgi:hypothetical protein
LSNKIQKVGNKPWKQGIGKKGEILPKSNARNLMQVSIFWEERQQSWLDLGYGRDFKTLFKAIGRKKIIIKFLCLEKSNGQN